ncbi:PAS domain S-box protein [Neobacillus sp. PS3-34]|uniref:PAS domain S-box protein n=1 Tax=Neobacillus sp. PS3-34 TaxID=3070678 RepID=UPI0027E0FCC7|nr:PAS domain S-box protein [Neobacillus sp. PS3-34]WML49968.1 PAS domain S-box protein [Neobacillus sp. PS3-34]
MKKKTLLLLYFIFSIIWITGTNQLLQHFTPSPMIELIGHLKELFYVAVTGCFIYITLKRTEERNAAKIEEERLSTLINSMVDFVNFKDGEGRWIQANEFGLKLFQIEHVDYKGKKDSELAEYSTYYAEALRYCETSDEEAWLNGTITRVEETIPLPDGGMKTFDAIKVPLFNPDGSRQGLVIMGRDITERKHVEKLLAESQQQYKSLFDHSPDIVYLIDIEGNITNLNPQFKTITGYNADDYIGKNVIDILPQRYKESICNFFKTVITEIKPQMSELKIKNNNGDDIILECTSLPIIVNGKRAGIIGYGKDITQLRKAEERLRMTEKLSVVGELSASVAHEIRNPLTSLIGFVQLMRKEDDKHEFYYKIMLEELNRINHIVGELLLLAKPQQINFTIADIQAILYDVVSLLKTEANLHNIQIDLLFQEKTSLIECEPNQLKQLFINIIKNAVEASDGGESVSISLDYKDNEKASILIKDNGSGMSKDRLEKIGEPFYSSKEKGTGLGLTVSSKIVQQHNGCMTFKSEINEGTEVMIELPVKNSPGLVTEKETSVH